MSAGVETDAAGLAAALRALGVDCAVEARERLAVLVPRGSVPDLADPALRRAAVRLLDAHGFTHLALELVDTPGERAALPGNQPA